MNIDDKKKFYKEHLLFAASLIFIVAVFVWKINKGMATYDEAFYISIPYRMTQGDYLFFQEWHMTQTAFFLLYPIVKLYLAIAGSTEGIVIAMRIIWLLVHLLVVVFAYCILQRKNSYMATGTVTLFALFCAYGSMTFGYYTMGPTFAFLLVTLYISECNSVIGNILKGVFSACFVLNCPYCVVIYVAYLMYAIVRGIQKKSTPETSLKSMIWYHIGLLILVVPFAVYLLSGMTSISQFIECVKNILYDPQHPAKSLYDDILYPIMAYIGKHVIYLIAMAVLFVLGMVVKKRKEFFFIMLFLSSLFGVYEAVYHYMHYEAVEYNYICFPFFFLAVAGFVYKENKTKLEFIAGILLPVLYAACFFLSSNQRVRVIAIGISAGAFVSVYYIYDILKESRKSVKIMAGTFVLIYAFSFAYIDCVYTLNDNNAYELNAVIEDGPCKGIVTNDAFKIKYEQQVGLVESLGDIKEKNVLFYDMDPIYYVISDGRNANFSSINFELDSIENEKMQNYYLLNSEKKPDIIVALIDEDNEMKNTEYYKKYAQENGYIFENGNPDYWEQYVIMRAK